MLVVANIEIESSPHCRMDIMKGDDPAEDDEKVDKRIAGNE